ncbi:MULTISPECIES: hypothetical protein [Rhodococcus]|uniref:hypothetical protein n=1 Tax=Rhodococcus TaxID=1827 RepID=UPI001F3F6B0D|nr:hypothetical protein [Rhodococcus pyridinivorans]
MRTTPPAERFGAGTARGYRATHRPEVWGALIGAGGASAFMLVNGAALGSPWVWIVAAGWVCAVVVFAWAVLVRPRRFEQLEPPSKQASTIYLVSVVAMIVLIVGGARLLASFDRSELTVAWVVCVVGAHFVPFARAFGRAMFRVMGWGMLVIGIVGLAGGFAASAVAAVAGVAAGLWMFAVMVADAVGRPPVNERRPDSTIPRAPR